MDPMMGGGSLSPEQIQALMEYGVGQGAFAEQDRAIQQQLAQAMALRNRPQTPHTTGGGAMYGGIGDLLTQVAGQNQEKNQRAADAALQQERIRALRRLAAAYGQQQQPPMDPTQGVPPMLARPPGM